MWTLIRLQPLMIGNWIPRDVIWNICLKFSQINEMLPVIEFTKCDLFLSKEKI